MRTAANFGGLAVAALALTVLPGGGAAIEVALTLLSIAFFLAIAVFGIRLYRENRFTLDSLAPVERQVLYGSIGLALLVFTASRRLFDLGGAGVGVWLALLAAASYGVFWVWQRGRSYG